jgi:hypothetical protein
MGIKNTHFWVFHTKCLQRRTFQAHKLEKMLDLTPSREQARATLGGEFPDHALFRYMQRVPNSTMVHVSCSLSKIPYVGFSPVRLQIGFRLRPSLIGSWLKCEANMHDPRTPVPTWLRNEAAKFALCYGPESCKPFTGKDIYDRAFA